jgi:glycosyltransferase involved in cell wall biosynthesis
VSGGAVKVLLDDQIFLAQRHGGISRYFTELLAVFDSTPELGIELATPFHYVANEHLRDYAAARFRTAPLPAKLLRRPIVAGLNSLRRGPRRTRRQIVHHTYYFPEYLRLPARKRVCTVYDMTPELMPEVLGGANPHRAKERFVRECDAILCISHTTKRDLLAIYGELDKPVVVAPLGVTARFFAAAARTSEAPYMLFVGGRFSYKNFDVVLRAMASQAPALRSRLICTGGGTFTAAELARFAELDIAELVEHRQIDDADLPGWYAAAICLVFPSRYEGFGLPTVEAFASGCPVVLAEMDCAVEVGADAAQYFGADDEQGLATILERLAADRAEREKWIALGRARAAEFTWRRTAEITAEVYRSLSQG